MYPVGRGAARTPIGSISRFKSTTPKSNNFRSKLDTLPEEHTPEYAKAVDLLITKKNTSVTKKKS